MKILINTISQEDVINAVEAASKLSKEEQDFANTLSAPTIKDKIFIRGEWIHVEDQWMISNANDLGKYPNIKEAHVVLEERTRRAFEDYGLDSFAQGLKQAAEQYGDPLPEIADTVIKIVPIKVEVIE